MDIERGWLGRYPYAAVGSGPAMLVLAGLSPTTGPGGDGTVKSSLGPLAVLAGRRRLVVVNRRPELPRGMTMAELAAEHARLIREELGGAVDVAGTSTGGSIAQQLAADHPGAVRRLVLLSTACRLGPYGKELQRRVAARIRRGANRQALAVMAAALVPPGRGRLPAGALAWALGPRLVRDQQGLDDMATTIEAEDEFDLAACRGAIQSPALIVAGREDRFYTPALFEETARLIPGSRLEILDGRGHITALLQRRVRELLSEFVAP